MKRSSYVLSLITFLAMSALVASQTNSENKPTAPPFKVTTLDGETLELAALRGKIVVLNFWFTGCLPCVAEFDKLNTLVKEFGDKGVIFIAPTLDDVTALRPFLKKHRFEYRVVPSATDLIVTTYSDGSEDVAFPSHIVIDKQGRIETRAKGADQVGALRKAILRLVSKGSG